MSTKDKLKELLRKKAASGDSTAKSVLSKINKKESTNVPDVFTKNQFSNPELRQSPLISKNSPAKSVLNGRTLEEPTKSNPRSSANIDDYFALSPNNISNTLGKTADIASAVGGFLTEKIGQAVGFGTGGMLGSMTAGINKLNPDQSFEGRIKYVFDKAKEGSEASGGLGKNAGAAGASFYPSVFKGTFDVGRGGINLVAGKEDKFYESLTPYFKRYLQGVPGITSSPGQVSKDQIINYFKTGNFEGDYSQFNEKEIKKALLASLIGAGMDIYFASQVATGAYNSIYKNADLPNTPRGWKPTEQYKIDNATGITKLLTKEGEITGQVPPRGQGVTTITRAEPTLGRRLSQPVTPLRGQGKVAVENSGPLVTEARTGIPQGQAVPPATNMTARGTMLEGRTNPQVNAPLARPQLSTGEGVKTSITPVDSPQAGFQMIDKSKTSAIKSLTTKLQNKLKEKQDIVKSGRSTPAVISEVKNLQKTIKNLEKSIAKATASQIQKSGPITNNIVTKQVINPQPTTKPTTKPVAKPVSKPVAKKPVAKPVAKKPVKTVITSKIKKIEPEETKVDKLYHGSDLGKLKVDRQGNINLGTSKEEIARFGSPLELDTSKMKIMKFKTKEDLFRAVDNKGYYSRKGFDILMSGNHAIAINPRKFASQFNQGTFDAKRQIVGALQKRFEDLSKPVVPPGRPKSEGVTEAKAYEARKKFFEKQRQNKPKSYQDYLKEAEAKKAKESKETPEQIRARLAKEKEAVAKRRAEGKFTPRELEDDFINRPKTAEKDLMSELKELKNRGKDELYFHDLHNKYFLDFLEGKSKTDKSVIVSKFIDENFGIEKVSLKNQEGSIELKKLVETPFKAASIISSTANALDRAWQYLGGKTLEIALGKKGYYALRNVGEKFSNLKIKVGQDDNVHVFYPLEYLTGHMAKKVMAPYKVDYYKGKAEAKQQAIDLGKYLSEFSKAEQEEIVERIVNMKYDNSPLGVAAKKTEEKFTEVGWQLVDAGIMPEETFKYYLGKYFPRMYRSFEDTQKWYGRVRSEKLDLDYLKLKRDAFGVQYRQDGKNIVEKFSTRQERDIFAKDLRAKKIKYDTFSPLSQSKKEELQEIRTAAYPAAKRMMQELMDITKVKYFNKLASDTRIARNERNIDKGFVNKMPDDPRYGALRNKYVHEFYINELKGMVEIPNQVDSALRYVNSVLKGMKTIVDTGVTTANMVSNFFLADLAGVPIERVDYWTRNLYNSLTNKGAYKELSKAGQVGRTMAGEELQNFLSIDTEMEQFKSLLNINKDSGIFDIAKVPFELVKRGWLKAGDLYSFSEDWAKSTCYDWAKNELKMSEQEAIKFAQEAIFDYGQVSRFLNLIRRTPLGTPFPTFAAKMTRNMVKAQIKKPFTVAKWHYILSTLAGLSLTAAGITEDDIKKVKPAWQGDWFIVGDVTRDKRGQIIDIQLIDLSRYLPWGQMTHMSVGVDSLTDLMFQPKIGSWYAFGDGSQGLISAWEPAGLVIKPFFEVAFNYSEFYQSEIFDEYDSLLTKLFTSFDYLERAWGPSWAPPLVPGGKGGSNFDKMWSAFNNVADFWGRRYSIMEAFLRLVGTKIQHVDPSLQFDFQISGLQKDLKNYYYKLNSEEQRYNNAMDRENTDETKDRASDRWKKEQKAIQARIDRIQEMLEDTMKARENFFNHSRQK